MGKVLAVIILIALSIGVFIYAFRTINDVIQIRKKKKENQNYLDSKINDDNTKQE